MNDSKHKSAAGLVGDAMGHVGSLVRGEMDLARAEVNENMKAAAVAVGLLIGAVVVALTSLNVLTAALVAGLTEAGLHGGWAALIVGVILAGVAYAMVQKGTNDLQLSSLAPTRTAENVKRDAEAVKEAYNDN